MRLSEKHAGKLLRAVTTACGLLGFALFMWTPKTAGGILAFTILLAIFAIAAVVLFRRNRESNDPAGQGGH
jgi:hypothetical protein